MSLISSLSFLRQSPQLVGKYKEDMPQSLLITDFEGNAIMNPSLITRHTTTRHMIRDVPVELKVAAAAISDGNESRNCSFMKIPVG